VDDTDFKSIETLAYNAGMTLKWVYVTLAGVVTITPVTPTDTGGNYDWVSLGSGMFTIEIPATGGASINNDTEGYGWFVGYSAGITPWRGPVIEFTLAIPEYGIVVDDASNSIVSFKTDLASAVDNYCSGSFVKFISGNCINQTRKIAAPGYGGTSKFVLVTSGFSEEPMPGDTFIIINQ
jgi:hypothetical protein